MRSSRRCCNYSASRKAWKTCCCAASNSGLDIATRLLDHTGGAANRLAEPQRIALFRIVQEAINNAIKHAQPASITVEISHGPQRLLLTIVDDGLGLAASNRLDSGGIKNMQIRAQLLGADMHIDKGPGQRGTQVRVSLPLPMGALAQEA